jgi:MFS family permease
LEIGITKPLATRRIAAGVVALCFAAAFTGRGLLESFVVFVLPLSLAFGWDRAEVVSIYAFAVFANGVVGPLVGGLFDRAGPRSVYVTGLGLLGGGFLLAAHADALWQFQLCLGLGVGIAAACLGNVPNGTLLARWFRQRLTFVTSIAFSAFGIGILALVPLAQVLNDRLGWRGAYEAMGGATLVLLVPLLLLPWRRLAAGSPELARIGAGTGALQSWTLMRALRHPAFWGLFFVYFFTSAAMFAIVPQVVAYLVAVGFAPLEAATAWGFSGMLLPLGMIIVGWLDGVIGRRRSVLLSYALSFIGIVELWLLGQFPNLLLLGGFIACFGGMLGSRGPLISSIALRVFGGPAAATIFGTIGIGNGFGAALGTWIGGLLHDWTGHYDAVLAFAGASVLCAVLPFLLVRDLRG